MATNTRLTLIEELRTRVGDAKSETGVTDAATYIAQAVLEFSRYSPRTAIIEITGDGTDEYNLDDSSYLDGFSVIEEVRSVPNSTSTTAGFFVPPKILTTDEWTVSHNTNGTPVLHVNYSPSSTDLIVVKATALHTVTDSTTTTTVPDHQAGAFADLAASLLLESASNSLLSTRGQDTAGDFIVPQVQIANAYRERSVDMRERFNDFFGIGSDTGSGSAKPVLITRDLDAGRRKGRERLTHPRNVW